MPIYECLQCLQCWRMTGWSQSWLVLIGGLSRDSARANLRSRRAPGLGRNHLSCKREYDLLSGPGPALLVLFQDAFDVRYHHDQVCLFPLFNSRVHWVIAGPIWSTALFHCGCCHRHPNSRLLRKLILVREKFVFINNETDLIWRPRIGVFLRNTYRQIHSFIRHVLDSEDE